MGKAILAAGSQDDAVTHDADGRREADIRREALSESRERWRDLVLLGSDLAFETDRQGRFVFLVPDVVLGWPAERLLGCTPERLLGGTSPPRGFDPFSTRSPARGRRVWLRRADGTPVCLSFAASPLRDARGRWRGARGVAQDVTEQDDAGEAIAAALRRSEALDHILWHVRQEVMAPRMMQAALATLVVALGCDGVAVVELQGGAADSDLQPVLRHMTDRAPENLANTVGDLVMRGAAPGARAENDWHGDAWTGEGTADRPGGEIGHHDDRPSDPSLIRGTSPAGERLLLWRCETRFGVQAVVVAWRAETRRCWNTEDGALLVSSGAIICMILEHDAIQQEMARQARTDPLTGLLNRRAFIEEVTRRIDRLDREGVPATLMFVDLDHFKRLNDVLGHDVGDDALCAIATLLRGIVRPADLVARLGGDEFALWLDGMEELSAAERAEILRVEGPAATAHLRVASGSDALQPITLSIGIATRWPGRGEDVDAMIHRADQVMYEVKRAGRGHWRVSRADSW